METSEPEVVETKKALETEPIVIVNDEKIGIQVTEAAEPVIPPASTKPARASIHPAILTQDIKNSIANATETSRTSPISASSPTSPTPGESQTPKSSRRGVESNSYAQETPTGLQEKGKSSNLRASMPALSKNSAAQPDRKSVV